MGLGVSLAVVCRLFVEVRWIDEGVHSQVMLEKLSKWAFDIVASLQQMQKGRAEQSNPAEQSNHRQS